MKSIRIAGCAVAICVTQLHAGDVPLEFVESDGIRALPIGYCANPSSRIEVDFRLVGPQPRQTRLFGADASGANFMASLYVTDKGGFSFGIGDEFSGYWTNRQIDEERHLAVIDVPSRRLELSFADGGIVQTITAPCTRTARHAFALFGRSCSWTGWLCGSFCRERIYVVRIFEHGKLKHDLRPVLRGGARGFADAVTGAFHCYDSLLPPHWEPIVTEAGALPNKGGHVQGIAVDGRAIYLSKVGGYFKVDWRGHLLKKCIRPDLGAHIGDICIWKGRIYAALCPNAFDSAGHGFGKDGRKLGMIEVLDTDLNVIKRQSIDHAADGITALDGILYVGLGSWTKDETRPWRGTRFGKYDAETLAPLTEDIYVDTGYDSIYGVQNMATDGERIYVGFYTPDEAARTPNFIVFDRNFKVLRAERFGYGHGFDFVLGGKGDARRFVFNLTISGNDSEFDKRPMHSLLTFAEFDQKGMRDITQYGGFTLHPTDR